MEAIILSNPEIIKAQEAFDKALLNGKSAEIKKAATNLSDTKVRVERAYYASDEYKLQTKKDNADFRNSIRVHSNY